jgi:hypothetical protein
MSSFKRYATVLLLVISHVTLAQQWLPSSTAGGTVVTVRKNRECIDVFAGFQTRGPDGKQLARGEARVELILTPGCESKIAAVRTGVWPEFSNHLRFEFGLAADRNEKTSESRQLDAKLVSDYAPLWNETGSVRTLVFRLVNLPEGFHGELLITVFEKETRLVQLKIRFPPSA